MGWGVLGFHWSVCLTASEMVTSSTLQLAQLLPSKDKRTARETFVARNLRLEEVSPPGARDPLSNV